MKTEEEMMRVLERINAAIDRWRSLKTDAPTDEQMIEALAVLERNA